MPLDRKDVGSRPLADPELMRRLRERAMVRLREEERAAGVVSVTSVSRRGVMRRFGVLLAGVLPGVAALLKTQAAFAATPGNSVRSCAPQYGAPSWPVTSSPPLVPMLVPATHSRTELANVRTWMGASALVASEKGSGGWAGLQQTEARQAFYDDGWGGGTHRLLALTDPDSDGAYILRGDQTFYAVVGGDMYGYLLGAGVLVIHASLFAGTRGGKNGWTKVIEDFAQVSDWTAYEKDRQSTTINLEKGLPQAFWLRNDENSGWRQNQLSPVSVKREGDLLTMLVRSDGHPSTAWFKLDLKSRKLLKTKFEGKEWNA